MEHGPNEKFKMITSQKRKIILIVMLFAMPFIILMTRIVYLQNNHQHKTKSSVMNIATQLSSTPLQKPQILVTTGSPSELAPWQDGEFIDCDSTTAAQFVDDIVEREGAALSVEQRKGLSDLIIHFFQSYSTGQFENYLDFKTRGKKYDLDFSSPLSADLINSFGITNPQLPQEPKAKLKKIWEMVSAIQATVDMSPRLKQVQPSRTKILIRTNDFTRGNLLQYCRGVSSMYPNFAPNSLIKYDESPEMVTKEDGHLLVALLQVNARFSTSDSASPIFVTFYWSSKEAQWYPMDLAKYRASRFTVLF
jgi:hypothetical protein